MTEFKRVEDYSEDGKIVRISQMYVQESEQGRRERLNFNKKNFDVYHGRQDWSYKKKGQSREFLAKQSMAVEQITQFFQQGLVDMGEWFSVDKKEGVVERVIGHKEIYELVDDCLDRAGYMATVGDSIKLGLLGSLMINKVYGKYVDKVSYTSEQYLKGDKIKSKLKRHKKPYWKLCIETVRQQDFYPDPTGAGLYYGHESWLDYHEVKALSEGEHAIYDPKIVEKLVHDYAEDEKRKNEKARETGQSRTDVNIRKKVKLIEFWGKIVDATTSEVLYDDVVWTIADDKHLIRKPEKNPFWHGKIPFIFSPIITVPHSVWHKALMDAPTNMNMALNELYNLILDAGMMATYGIKQYRPDWMEDESQASDGFNPGQSIAVNENCPPGGKVLERIDTSSMSSESLAVFNLTNSEFNQSALTNDLRMGVMPSRAVKATEVVEASQTITSVFTGIGKILEETFTEPTVELAWLTCLQHITQMDEDDLISILGEDKAREILAMNPEDIFSEVALGHKFKVFGIGKTLTKMKDYKKIVALLQTISGSPVLMQEFMTKYNVGKLLGEIIRSLDINEEKLTLNPQEQQQAQQKIQQMQQMMALQKGGGAALQNGPGADQSQIPQMTAGSENPMAGGPQPAAM